MTLPTPQPSELDTVDFLAKLQLSKLTETQRHNLNAPLSPEKIKKTINSLPIRKSSGPDGFTTEYYTAFQHILSPHLVNLYSKAAEVSSFPPEMLKAYIVTIPKPGTDPKIPKNSTPYLY